MDTCARHLPEESIAGGRSIAVKVRQAIVLAKVELEHRSAELGCHQFPLPITEEYVIVLIPIGKELICGSFFVVGISFHIPVNLSEPKRQCAVVETMAT